MKITLRERDVARVSALGHLVVALLLSCQVAVAAEDEKTLEALSARQLHLGDSFNIRNPYVPKDSPGCVVPAATTGLPAAVFSEAETHFKVGHNEFLKTVTQNAMVNLESGANIGGFVEADLNVKGVRKSVSTLEATADYLYYIVAVGSKLSKITTTYSLNSDLWKNINHSIPELVRRCGTHFISSIDYGRRVFAVVRIRGVKKTDRDEIYNSLNVDGSGKVTIEKLTAHQKRALELVLNRVVQRKTDQIAVGFQVRSEGQLLQNQATSLATDFTTQGGYSISSEKLENFLKVSLEPLSDKSLQPPGNPILYYFNSLEAIYPGDFSRYRYSDSIRLQISEGLKNAMLVNEALANAETALRVSKNNGKPSKVHNDAVVALAKLRDSLRDELNKCESFSDGGDWCGKAGARQLPDIAHDYLSPQLIVHRYELVNDKEESLVETDKLNGWLSNQQKPLQTTLIETFPNVTYNFGLFVSGRKITYGRLVFVGSLNGKAYKIDGPLPLKTTPQGKDIIAISLDRLRSRCTSDGAECWRFALDVPGTTTTPTSWLIKQFTSWIRSQPAKPVSVREDTVVESGHWGPDMVPMMHRTTVEVGTNWVNIGEGVFYIQVFNEKRDATLVPVYRVKWSKTRFQPGSESSDRPREGEKIAFAPEF